MIKLDTMVFGSAGAQQIIRLDRAPEGMNFLGLRLAISMPYTVTTSAVAGGTALIKAALNHCLSSFTLKYGFPARNRVAYQAATGAQLRNVYRLLERNEVECNCGTGATFNVGSGTLTFDLFIPFVCSSIWGVQRLPGSTQVRTMELTILESASTSIVTNMTRAAGSMTIDVVPVYRPGPDQWSPLISYRLITASRLEAESEEGLVLGAWEESNPLSTSALTAFNLWVGGSPVHTELPPSFVGDEWKRIMDVGGADLSDDITPLYFADPALDLEDQAHGKVRFRQSQTYLSQIALGVVMIPELSGDEAAAAASAGSVAKAAPVLASKVEAPTNAHPGAAAVLPVRLYSTSKSEFVTRAGHLAVPGGKVQVSIPPVLNEAVTATAQSAGDSTTKQAVVKVAQKRILAQIGGATASSGKSQGDARAKVRGAFSQFF